MCRVRHTIGKCANPLGTSPVPPSHPHRHPHPCRCFLVCNKINKYINSTWSIV